MKKFLALFLSTTLLSMAGAKAADQEAEHINQGPNLPQALVQYNTHSPHSIIMGHLKLGESGVPHQKYDTGQARIQLSQSVANLKAIGKSAATEYDSMKEDCKSLDAEQAKLPADLSGLTGSTVIAGGVLTPFFNEHLYIVNLPKDTLDRFDHRRWAENLSSNNAGSDYLNLESYNSTQLADGLYLSARHCNSHSDAAGHRYTGTGYCCQYYTRGVRQELIQIAQTASRHSRGHEAYVQEFNKFDQQMQLLYNRHANLIGAYPGVFVQAAYPVRPTNNYVRFDFRNWLIQIASNNNTPAILNLTDLDDPGMMADKVFVSTRYAIPSAGYGTSSSGAYQYTSWNWYSSDGRDQIRSMRVEIFEVALGLVRNQRNHDNYVTQALQFETAAKNLVSNYWLALQRWNGIPTTLGTAVVQHPESSNANTTYQRLKDNRNQLRSHLTKAMAVLKSASDCEQIANTVSATSESLSSEVDTLYQDYTTLRDQSMLRSGLGEGLSKISLNDLEGKVATLTAEKQQLVNRLGEIEGKNDDLGRKVQDFSWEKRERELKEEFNKMMEQRLKEEKERDKDAVAFLLGNMLYELKGQKDDNDLDKFKAFNLQEMVQKANILVLNPVRKLIEKK